MAGHSYEHDVEFASRFGFLGSIDANTGDTSLGWDTDQFPMNLNDAAKIVLTVLTQGGIAPGGLNFDAKVRRESTEDEDLFIAHIGAMDTFALALRRIAPLHTSGALSSLVSSRYSSFNSDFGSVIESGKSSFAELEKIVLSKPTSAAEAQEPKKISGQQEKYEQIWNNYLYATK